MIILHFNLGRVVQKVDKHRINQYLVNSVVCFVNIIHWIAIYPVDRVIQPLNNRGLYVGATPANLTGKDKLDGSFKTSFTKYGGIIRFIYLSFV